MNKILDAGVIGTGGIATDHLNAVVKSPKTRLTAISSRSKAKAKAVAQKFGAKYWYTSWKDLVKEAGVDYVIICSPTYLHPEMTLNALDHGKHVLCEKPIATNLDEAKEMIRYAKEAEKKLLIGHNQRYIGVNQKIKELVEKKALGNIIHIWHNAASMYVTGTRPWVLDTSKGGGPFMEQRVHMIDLIRWWVGDVDSVYAQGSFSPVSLTDFKGEYHYQGYPKPQKNDMNNYAVTLTFKSGTIGQICSSHTSFLEGGETYLIGTKGTIRIKPNISSNFPTPEMEIKTLETDSGQPPPVLREKAEYYSMRAHTIEQQLNDFIECILQGKAPPIPPEEAYSALEIVVAIWQSVEKGEIITLPISK